MTDEHLHEDPVLQLVLRTRPPIRDEDLSPTGQRATAILQRLLGAEAASAPVRRRRASPRAFLAVVLPVLSVAAVVLLIAGVFSGPASTGTQPAIAAVIRGVEKATALKPGTIVVSKYRDSYRNRAGQPASFTIETIYQTPAGPGPQSSLYVNSEYAASWEPTEQAVSGGDEEVYVNRTNTIYISSIWGPYITKGKKPGTFIYTPVNTPPGVRSATLPAKPLTLTAQQAHALLGGSAMISSTPIGSHIPYPLKLEVVPVTHFPSDAQAVRDMLKFHGIRVIGLTTVNGRRAIELAGPKFNPRLPENGGGDAGVEVWVDPKTYVPIKEVVDRRPLFEDAQTWIEYKTLPITPTNERLLSLIARHPHARIDRNHKEYLKADNGDAVFTG
jgi:hypothetical protein